MAEAPLTFDVDWQPSGDGVRAPELAATWARLEIEVGGAYPTIVRDIETGIIRRSIVVSLFPLAEWVSYNWWGLLFGSTKGTRAEGDPGSSFTGGPNNLRAAGDGFAWPDLSVRRDGGALRVVWQEDSSAHPGWPVRFLTSGSTLMEVRDLERSLSGLVEATLVRMEEAGIRASSLHKEWQALKDLDPEEVEFCQACGRLGIDPFSEGAELADLLQEVCEALDGANRDDFLDAMRPGEVRPALSWLEGARLELGERASKGRHGVKWSNLPGLRASVQADLGPGREMPYQVGYRQAQTVRQRMELAPTSPLGADDLPVSRRMHEPSPSAGLQGISLSSQNREHATLILGWSPSPASELFASARSLWGLVFDQTSTTLLTGAPSRRQQISRAFAAELLAPAEGLHELLGSAPEWRAPIAADHFGVSEKVVQHQIENRLNRDGVLGH